MKKGILNKLLPHILALAVFLVVALIYCKPALVGKVVNQSDVTQWKGAIQTTAWSLSIMDQQFVQWHACFLFGLRFIQCHSVVYSWNSHVILANSHTIFFSGLYLFLFSLHRSKN